MKARFLQIHALLALTMIFISGIPDNSRAQGWYDINWHYRQGHTINPSFNAGSGYQVRIVARNADGTSADSLAYLKTHAKVDFGDVRFTAGDGTTLLDYWLEAGSMEGNSAAFWVEVSGSLENTPQVIYIYYGNSGATTTSNGGTTFSFFDDFNSLDNTKWTLKGAGTRTFSGGYMTVAPPHVNPSKLVATAGTTGVNNAIVARFRVNSMSNPDERAGVGVRTDLNENGRGYNFEFHNAAQKNMRFEDDWIMYGNNYPFNWVNNEFYIMEAFHNGPNYLKGRKNFEIWNTQLNWISRPPNYTSLVLGSHDANTTWDWAFIRKCIVNEPAHGAWEAEETNYYVWNKSGSASWLLSNSWMPNRTVEIYDILVFNSDSTRTATNVPTQSIAQLIVSGNTTANLTSSVTATLLVNDFLSTTSGAVVSFGGKLLLGGTLPAISNNGKIQTSIPTTTSATPLPPGKTWGGIVEYNGTESQTVVNGSYSNLALSGSGAKTAAGTFSVSGTTTITGITFKSGTTTGYSSSLGILSLGSGSTIALGTGIHTLTFANSITATWSGNLTITGWQGGWNGTAGTAGKIFFGANAYGLTNSQSDHIWFYDGTSYFPAVILSSGEVVPKVQIAKVNTNGFTINSITTATCPGEVTDDLGYFITARGIVWHTVSNPTIATNTGKTNNGIGLGGFSGSLAGLVPGQLYYARAYATNSLGTAYGQEVSFVTTVILPTVTTSLVSNITIASATCGGNVTNDGGGTITARGVCWGIPYDPDISGTHTSDGAGTGSFISSFSGLIPGQTYFARAYATNISGTAYGESVGFITPGFMCGSSLITRIHNQEFVVPETKTVTYGTVTNIPGEPTKCWITKNLGATSQASSVSDNTEDAAGWYWQFNRMQGYKNDGTNATTPTWPTQYNYSDQNDWLPAQDPCSILLNSSWRIPTATEWTNVDASGNWIDPTGPWNSGLKLHFAGNLWTNGQLGWRGVNGLYSSINREGETNCLRLKFVEGPLGGCYISAFESDRASGNPLRCIHAGVPVVSITAAGAVTPSTAVVTGYVSDDGGETVIQRGVCWSTSASPTISGSHSAYSSGGTGSYTITITGLTAGQTYYVRAYAINSEGTAYSPDVFFATYACGNWMFVVTHATTGNVAPVNKYVVYSTVTNIPGEPAKCWITSNLGADRQATDVHDATEASAGWYWQFNRKQGYNHDGATRTPNTAWITSISENTDWITANDPCAIELGMGWRIPTNSEWTNVDANGSWANWNGPFGSALKLHAAGALSITGGSVFNRGAHGVYWSSTQNGVSYGWGLNFNSVASNPGSSEKSLGCPTRCIRSGLPGISTTALSSITTTTASSGGNVTTDGGSAVTARGVCWSTSPSPVISGSHTSNGGGTGTFISSMTGLTAGQCYFARAYATSSEGTAYGNEVKFTTSITSCGSSTITINHVEGDVAPEAKITTYGTVTNIPGEPSKCWITRNLGSSQQAIAVNDATESAAGWYWQFYRKQGYKHDGTTRTPASSWISTISENADWASASDPCALEFGNGWRLPTGIEWTNLDGVSGGNWINCNGPWNSGLKLHAAGYLWHTNGALSRGWGGYYWGSTQNVLDHSSNLTFEPSQSFIQVNPKSFGLPVRCLHEAFPAGTSSGFNADTTCGAPPCKFTLPTSPLLSQTLPIGNGPLVMALFFQDRIRHRIPIRTT
jgi:hypothetical protein